MERIGSGPVGVDTVAFIYWIEEHPAYTPQLEPVFRAMDAGSVKAITSTLTLLEVLVVPYRSRDTRLAAQYEAILSRSRGLELVDLDRGVLRAAAALRASHPRIRTPDAIQLATAIAAGCRFFITNDRHLPSLHGIEIVTLD